MRKRHSGGWRRTALIAAVGIAVGALAGPPAVSLASKVQEVIVTNGADQPLHVTGDDERPLHVVGDVGVTGTPSVRVAGTPKVEIQNTPAVSVIEPEMFQASGFLSVPAGDSERGDLIDIPNDKALLVEYVTVIGRRVDRVSLRAGSIPGDAVHIPLERHGQRVAGSELTQVRLSPSLVMWVERDDSTLSGSLEYTLTGRLVPR